MLQGIFSPDNKVMVFITKIVNCVYLNILWLICCIPIVTAGASTTALFYVTLKMVRDEEGNVGAQFFRAFKANFKSSLKAWLIMLGLGIILIFDGYVFYHMHFENIMWTILTAIFLVAIVAYFMVSMYIYPLMARFENTTFAMFRNSLMISVRFLLCTVLMAAIYYAMLFVIINIFTPAVVFGEGLCAYLCSYLLVGVFDKISPAVQTEEQACSDREK